jgi:hypothetical protein
MAGTHNDSCNLSIKCAQQEFSNGYLMSACRYWQCCPDNNWREFMKTKSTIFAGLASLALGMSAAQAGVLDFNGPNVCNDLASGNGTAGACGNWVYIAQSYGDIAGVLDVRYAAPRYTDTSLEWWDADYNNLRQVAFAPGGDGDSKGRIDLVPLNGQAVTLTHFDLGAYPNTARGTTVTVSDLNGNVLMSYAGSVGGLPGNLPSAFDGSWSSMSGIRIEWQDSAYNVGIDNITYSIAAVPEPATYATMSAGLVALAMLARRRRN